MNRGISGMWRQLLAEFIGTAMLVTVVIGSGIAAAQLSPTDVGLQLLENALATALGLAVLILVFGPVSGAHFNPFVSLGEWALRRRAAASFGGGAAAAYAVAQTAGAVVGAMLANAMFERAVVEISRKDRLSAGHLVAEVVATAGLIMVIFALARAGRAAASAAAVGAYIGAAYWFTSSTAFANPAVTVGRMFSDSFAGIAPGSVGGFIAGQVLGAVLGLGLVVALYPDASEGAGQAVVPHEHDHDGEHGRR